MPLTKDPEKGVIRIGRAIKNDGGQRKCIHQDALSVHQT
jgi:hypothetical protein